MLDERVSAVRAAAPHIACTAESTANAGCQGFRMLDQFRNVVLLRERTSSAARLETAGCGRRVQSAQVRRVGHQAAEQFPPGVMWSCAPRTHPSVPAADLRERVGGCSGRGRAPQFGRPELRRVEREARVGRSIACWSSSGERLHSVGGRPAISWAWWSGRVQPCASLG
jgi:hypothetical protein